MSAHELGRFRSLLEVGFDDEQFSPEQLTQVAIAYGESLEDSVSPFDASVEVIDSILNDAAGAGITVPPSILSELDPSSHSVRTLEDLFRLLPRVDVEFNTIDPDMPGGSQRFCVACCDPGDAHGVCASLERLAERLRAWTEEREAQAELELYHRKQDELTSYRVERASALERTERTASRIRARAEHRLRVTRLVLAICRQLKKFSSVSAGNFHRAVVGPLVLLEATERINKVERATAAFLRRWGLSVEVVLLERLLREDARHWSYQKYGRTDEEIGYHYKDWLAALRNGDLRLLHEQQRSTVELIVEHCGDRRTTRTRTSIR